MKQGILLGNGIVGKSSRTTQIFFLNLFHVIIVKSIHSLFYTNHSYYYHSLLNLTYLLIN